MQLLPSIPATVRKAEGDATVLHLDIFGECIHQPKELYLMPFRVFSSRKKSRLSLE